MHHERIKWPPQSIAVFKYNTQETSGLKMKTWQKISWKSQLQLSWLNLQPFIPESGRNFAGTASLGYPWKWNFTKQILLPWPANTSLEMSVWGSNVLGEKTILPTPESKSKPYVSYLSHASHILTSHESPPPASWCVCACASISQLVHRLINYMELFLSQNCFCT